MISTLMTENEKMNARISKGLSQGCTQEGIKTERPLVDKLRASRNGLRLDLRRVRKIAQGTDSNKKKIELILAMI